jgi:hypothetical protein
MRGTRGDARKPHPDPATEAELQLIMSIRRTAERKEQLAADMAKHIKVLRRKVTGGLNHPGGREAAKQAELRMADIREIEAEIAAIHDDIAARIARITPTDLSYLPS